MAPVSAADDRYSAALFFASELAKRLMTNVELAQKKVHLERDEQDDAELRRWADQLDELYTMLIDVADTCRGLQDARAGYIDAEHVRMLVAELLEWSGARPL